MLLPSCLEEVSWYRSSVSNRAFDGVQFGAHSQCLVRRFGSGRSFSVHPPIINLLPDPYPAAECPGPPTLNMLLLLRLGF